MVDSPLGAVQRAAVERVRVDPADARRHLVLVGALERVREDAPEGPLAATFASLVAVQALRASESSPPAPATSPLAAWSPGDTNDSLVREGAAVAVRRFGLAPERAAEVGVSPETLDAAD